MPVQDGVYSNENHFLQRVSSLPPSIIIEFEFASSPSSQDGVFPPGEFQSYKDDNLWRESSAEKRERERLDADMVNHVRQAAEVHRQVGPGCDGGVGGVSGVWEV